MIKVGDIVFRKYKGGLKNEWKIDALVGAAGPAYRIVLFSARIL